MSTSMCTTRSTRSATAIRSPDLPFALCFLLFFFLDKQAYRDGAKGAWRLVGSGALCIRSIDFTSLRGAGCDCNVEGSLRLDVMSLIPSTAI